MSPTLNPAWSTSVLSVNIPPGERRNPIAMVKLQFGPLVLFLGVSRLKKAGLTVRLPMGDGGVPAVEAEPEAWAAIEHAAIAAVVADPVAREHVVGPALRHMARQPLKARGQAAAAG